MSKATNGHALNGSAVKKVLADEMADNQAAEVMNRIRGHLPLLLGKSETDVAAGVKKFLEDDLGLTKVHVNTMNGGDHLRVYPAFSINGTVIEMPGKIIQNYKIAGTAAVYS